MFIFKGSLSCWGQSITNHVLRIINHFRRERLALLLSQARFIVNDFFYDETNDDHKNNPKVTMMIEVMMIIQ